MSESYTIGGDTFAEATPTIWLGQTFHVIERHTLRWIDLTLKSESFLRTPILLLFQASVDHEPTGDYISRDVWWEFSKWWSYLNQRVRIRMTPVDLIPGIYYCFYLQVMQEIFPNHVHWHYDQGDATYPRGLRISSTDSGVTWTKHHNDDHMFVEFGDPPSPKPPPEPPIINFIPTKLVQTYTPDGVNIKLGTNVPCHLTLYWTRIKPKKHHLSRTVRGLEVPWFTRYCFVSYHEVEQIEPGDTLYHTFIVTPWPVCESRWFTIRGNVNGELSPSVGPVFFKHKRPSFQKLLIAEPWTYLSPPPPDMSTIFTEPWTEPVPFPNLLFTEPWTHLSPPPPDMELIFTEPWTHLLPPPPDMELILTEPWNYLSPPPPTMELIFAESWTEPIPFDNLLFTEPWTHLSPPPPFMELIITEPWTHHWSPPAWPFYEHWGTHLTENNPWESNLPLGGIDYELYNSLILLDNPSMDGCGIKCVFTPNHIPLKFNNTNHLLFKSISTAPAPTTHDAYVPCFLYTTNGVDSYLLEMIITRGDWWGPWGTLIWAGPNTAGKDYGLNPGFTDLTDFWVWARTEAGLSNNPAGWYIGTIALLFEAVEYEPNPYLICGFIGLWYLSVPPPSMLQLVVEPWTDLSPPPPSMEQKIFEEWSS